MRQHNSEQRATGHLIGSNHTAALQLLTLGDVNRDNAEVGLHESVNVAHSAWFSFEFAESQFAERTAT